MIVSQKQKKWHTRDRGATPFFILVSQQGSTRDGGATPYFSTVSPRQGCSSLHGRRTRDRGASPYFTSAPSNHDSSTPRGQRTRDGGASPCFKALPGEPGIEAAGRCRYPGAVSTVTAGASPFLSPGAVSPVLHRLPAPDPGHPDGRWTGRNPHPVMCLCRIQGAVGEG